MPLIEISPQVFFARSFVYFDVLWLHGSIAIYLKHFRAVKAVKAVRMVS